MDDKIKNFSAVSKGLLKGNFVFQADYYNYVEREQNTPADMKYTISTFEEQETTAVCEVKMGNGFLSVAIKGLNMKNGYFPKMICSKLIPHYCNISGNNENDFRILMMALPDIKPNRPIDSSFQICFDKGLPCSIGFSFHDMDENFHVSEIILNIYGCLKHYIENE